MNVGDRLEVFGELATVFAVQEVPEGSMMWIRYDDGDTEVLTLDHDGDWWNSCGDEVEVGL